MSSSMLSKLVKVLLRLSFVCSVRFPLKSLVPVTLVETVYCL